MVPQDPTDIKGDVTEVNNIIESIRTREDNLNQLSQILHNFQKNS